MPALFVAGAGTDVGKTYVAAALIRALRARGRAVDALKPVLSGFDPAAPQGSDPAVLLTALGRPVTTAGIARIAPFRFRAPLSPDEAARLDGATLSAEAVIALCRDRIAAAGETVVVVETAGGILSPLDGRTTMLDLAKALGAPALLVAGSYLGTISHTLTAAQTMLAANVALKAVVISESPDAPPMGHTLRAIGSRLPVPVFALARGGEIDPSLLDRL